MLWINATDLWIALTSALILMIFHYFSPWFAKKLPGDGEKFSSFAGGFAVAYVFLHMLPDLVEYNKPIGDFLLEHQWLTPFTELLIYLVALFGFLIYMGLDLIAVHATKTKQPMNWAYILHLIMFCLYNFLITYTMSLRAQASITATILFTVAMSLNFVLTDRKFNRLYGNQFNNTGRYILIFALLIGWLCSVIFDPVNVLLVAFMVAFLAGSVLLNVFKEELPSLGFTSYLWFVIGVFTISTMMLLQVWILKLHPHL